MSFGGNFMAVPICGVVQYNYIHAHDSVTILRNSEVKQLLGRYAKSCYNALSFICKDFLFRSR